MILIRTNLQKLHLVSLLDVQTDLFKHHFYSFIKHNTPVFGWKDQMIDQDRNVMTLM